MDKEKYLLQYNLQFFANDDATEEPTAKKKNDTRNKGQVAKSSELANAVSLLALFVILRVFVGTLGNNFQEVFRATWNQIPDFLLNASMGEGISSMTVRGMFIYTLLRILLMIAPFLAVGVLVAILINVLQFGFKITTEPMKPKLSKLNPASGVKRLFNKDAIMRLLLSIAKIALIAVIAYTTLADNANKLLVIFDIDLMNAVSLIGEVILDAGTKIAAVFLAIGFFDLFYQKKKFHKELMMTKQEVKDEFKNSEGDPEVKGKQKQRMREASMRRMMQDVPKADVVITNPTHLAVALRYDTEQESAPVVLAKGEDYVALKIREAAKEAGVQIVENKPLARMLYQTVEIGEEIPPELYQAVAEVLAMIYNLRAG
jgi:flagellar biosynthetic protein FlhB